MQVPDWAVCSPDLSFTKDAKGAAHYEVGKIRPQTSGVHGARIRKDFTFSTSAFSLISSKTLTVWSPLSSLILLTCTKWTVLSITSISVTIKHPTTVVPWRRQTYFFSNRLCRSLSHQSDTTTRCTFALWASFQKVCAQLFFFQFFWLLLKILIIVSSLSSRLVAVHITFVLNAINLQTVRHRELPDCYDFVVIVRPMTSVPDSAHTSGAHQTFTSSYLTHRAKHLTATPGPRAAFLFTQHKQQL